MRSEYTTEQMLKELNVFIRAGMLDTYLDDNGEWVYKIGKVKEANTVLAELLLNEIPDEWYDEECDDEEPACWEVREPYDEKKWWHAHPPKNWADISPEHWGQIWWVKFALKNWGYLPVEYQDWIIDQRHYDN